ncbi:MAG: hypothetical protein JSR45_17990 [Proteobacteria bacterium]|nr:hypothetical protein [Pseudomonadota bacterium]
MTRTKIDSVAWAGFFIWVGVVMLAGIPWGWALIGVGALILGSELVRWRMHGTAQGFWLACGVMVLAGGVALLVDLKWPLMPTLFILLGVLLLGRSVGIGRRRTS